MSMDVALQAPVLGRNGSPTTRLIELAVGS
jgi:hypothetical protein